MSVTRTARLLVEKAFIRRFLETLSGGRKSSDVLNEFIADERLRECIATIESAFPRFEMLLDDIIGEGHKIAIRGSLRGVHSGELMGIAPTHKLVTMPFIVILRVRGGKIEEHWPSGDVFGLLEQLNDRPRQLHVT